MRTTKTKLKALVKEFNTLFGGKELSSLPAITTRLKAMVTKRCDGVFNVIMGPFAHNAWTVYIGYNTSEKFIHIDLNELKADEDKWFNDVCDIINAHISHVDRALAEQNKPPCPIDTATAIDMTRAKNRMMRLRHDCVTQAQKDKLKEAERTLRVMRKDIWDLEDILHSENPTLESVKQYMTNFPTSCALLDPA